MRIANTCSLWYRSGDAATDLRDQSPERAWPGCPALRVRRAVWARQADAVCSALRRRAPRTAQTRLPRTLRPDRQAVQRVAGRHIHHVADPELVRPGSRKIALHEIGRRRRTTILTHRVVVATSMHGGPQCTRGKPWGCHRGGDVADLCRRRKDDPRETRTGCGRCPTVTHGEMAHGADVVAAERFGASEVVDPSPYAVGSTQEICRKYPGIWEGVTRDGYTEMHVEELAETIRATPCDLAIVATPVDLKQILDTGRQMHRVHHELQEIGQPELFRARVGKSASIRDQASAV